MHLFEDLALLTAYLESDLHAELRHLATDLVECLLTKRKINNHHHVEITACDGLRDIQNVDVVLRQVHAGLRENADRVLADHRNDNFFHGAIIS